MGFGDMRAAKEARGERRIRRAPVHLQVTVGRRARAAYGDVYGSGKAVTRGNEGSPILKDRFFIMEADPTDSVTIKGHEAKARRPHPDFMEGEGKTRRPRAYETLHCMVINAKREEWLDARLAMWVDPRGKRLSNKRPWCSSPDFKTAERWDDKAESFYTLKCPYRDCQFYGEHGGCKPHTSAVFMLCAADDQESNLIGRVSTKSPLTWHLLDDFVTQVEEQLAGLGLGDNWHGIRFTMKVTEGTGEGRRYPLIEFKLDGPLTSALLDRYQVIAKLKQVQAAAALPGAGIHALLPPPTAAELTDEWGDTDDVELSGEPLRPTAAPSAVIEASLEPEVAPDAPIAAAPVDTMPPVPDDVERAPDGAPVCWECASLMRVQEGRAGRGYTCACGCYITPDTQKGKATRRGSSGGE